MPAFVSLSKSNSWPSSKPLQCPRWSTNRYDLSRNGPRVEVINCQCACDCLLLHLRAKRRQDVSTSPITSQQGNSPVFSMSPLQSNVQSPPFSQIRSILSRPVENLPALSKLPVPSKVNHSVELIVRSNVNRSVKSSVQLKISLSRRAKFWPRVPSNSSLCLFIPVPSFSQVEQPKIKSC